MANLEILTIPDPILRQKSAPVEDVNDATRRFMDQMLATMYEAPGIGLAAIQVGEPRRIITIDVAREEEPKSPLFLINPEIVWSSEDERSTYEEGCLSIPDYYAEVERPAKVRVRYVDYDGKAAGARGGRAARHLRPARGGPSERRPLHRLHLQAEARSGREKIHQGGAREGTPAPAPDLKMALRVVFMGTPDFSVPTLDEDRRRRA